MVELLAREDGTALTGLLHTLHPSDLADLVEHLDESQRLNLIAYLPSDLVADTLAEMEDVERPGELLLLLAPSRAAAIVQEMADDDAADVIGELEPEDCITRRSPPAGS